MPNTVFGPYAPTSWVNGVSAANATTMNNLEKQASDALHSFNPDLIGAGFVYSGITTAKDGSVANQLDIASGVAYVVFSDGTVGRITVVTDNTHTTATPSTTYHLYLQPDGTWYWNTANTPAANSLHICDVTTDGSGNISTVTDTRPLYTTLFPGMAGNPGVGLIVAQAVRQHVTVTTLQTILTYAVVTSGIYRVSGYIYMGNGTAEKPVLNLQWTDPDAASIGQGFFAGNLGTGGSTTPLLLESIASLTQGGAIPISPLVIAAQSGHNIGVQYQDPGGTPNDWVTVIIERLA